MFYILNVLIFVCFTYTAIGVFVVYDHTLFKQVTPRYTFFILFLKIEARAKKQSLWRRTKKASSNALVFRFEWSIQART